MTDFSHLNAIQDRLHRETMRRDNAKTDSEYRFRAGCVQQAEKELAAEYRFLGIDPATVDVSALSDDDLLNELNK